MVSKKRALRAQLGRSGQFQQKKTQAAIERAERRQHKRQARLAHKSRKKPKPEETWDGPIPAHLVAILDAPKVISKYQSYFEFAENTEKKKKLETQVTKERQIPGCTFVPIGDPLLTNACKELSREKGFMIFIVSLQKEENQKISEHVHRIGYHFRDEIVVEAREIVGETAVSSMPTYGYIEPIPDSQEEINKQADAAIRDLFPRVPNTDRQQIIEHAFKKGSLFHGEPTVGLQSNIPLSRRVQLAALAHIRHTHTRYDKLLRETSWINARKAVEPVCLDILVKWRGDEETGRDQLDEILREVIIITESEGEDDSPEDDSPEDDSSSEEGEISSAISSEEPEEIPQPSLRDQNQSIQQAPTPRPIPTHQGPSRQNLSRRKAQDIAISSRTRAKVNPKFQSKHDGKKGLRRYQTAWEEALKRQQNASPGSHQVESRINPPQYGIGMPVPAVPSPYGPPAYIVSDSLPAHSDAKYGGWNSSNPQNYPAATQSHPHYRQQTQFQPSIHGNQVNVGLHPEPAHSYQQGAPALSAPSYSAWGPKPPQVVIEPQNRYSSDVLVPSIESPGDLASLRVDGWNGPIAGYSNSQAPYPRRIEQRVQSPHPRQVIVIDDDSPQHKRRRVLHEDEFGRPRPIPSRDYGFYVPPQHSDSHLIFPSSVQPTDFLHRNSGQPSQSRQGLSRDVPSTYTDPATAKQIPVYNAPESGFYLERPSRLDVPVARIRREEPHGLQQVISPQTFRENIPFQRSAYGLEGSAGPHYESHFERARQVDLGRDYHHSERRPLSPELPMSHKVDHYDIGSRPGNADRDFAQRFSQSRLDGPPTRAGHGFGVNSERSHQAFVGYGGGPQQGYSTSSSTNFARHRSPVSSVGRPRQYEQDSRQPIHHEHSHPPPLDRHTMNDRLPALSQQRPLPTFDGAPTYVRTLDPRRPVIILD